jgi:hypothetical protein
MVVRPVGAILTDVSRGCVRQRLRTASLDTDTRRTRAPHRRAGICIECVVRKWLFPRSPYVARVPNFLVPRAVLARNRVGYSINLPDSDFRPAYQLRRFRTSGLLLICQESASPRPAVEGICISQA